VIVPSVKIKLDGHIDDLYALSLLFRQGAYPDLHVVSRISGEKDGMLDRVRATDCRETYLTGNGCLPLINAQMPEEAGWIALQIIAPLNGYAALADSNFKPVVPVALRWERAGASGGTVFKTSILNRPSRLITVNRHALLQNLLPDRVRFMSENHLAAYAANVIARPPSWADYYRLLEDIAGYRSTTLEKLPEAGLAEREALKEFKKAANNRAFGRHGTSKRDTQLPQDSLMNLLEAREFVRGVISAWLDLECGGRLPRDRVDGGPLRFGLDSSEV
jgi:hypothetical protein